MRTWRARPSISEQTATVRIGSTPVRQPDPSRTGDIAGFTPELSEDDLVVRLVRAAESDAPPAGIDTARIIVAGGRGIGSAQDFVVLRELAGLLGAAVAGSRGAVDNGWLPHDCMVGQTGRSVRPDLYLACGISGALQHRTALGFECWPQILGGG